MIQREDRLRDLMVRSLAGDGSAYHQLLTELSGHLRAYFKKRLASYPDEAEDLVQETLLAVHNHRHTYDVNQPLTAWIYAVARYKLIDMRRRHGNRQALNDPLDDESELLGSSDVEAVQARCDIATLLQQLPDRQRLPIQYVKLDGLSVVEAARLTGMSASAVKIGVHRGLHALAAKMRGKH